MRPLTFIVGTGRSGSTTLSRMLNLHPDVLSLNELLASLVEPDRALPRQPLTGAEFWRILAEPSPVFDTMIRSGAPLPEFLDPRPGIPALSLMVLPHLTGDPDPLLDELARQVPRWPRRPAPEHHRALFGLLCARFGRRAVIERSGYSVHWIPRLHEAFPEARFVHLHRFGPDCALSMSRHPGYRTIAMIREILDRARVASLGELTPEHVAALPDDLAPLLADRFDPALIWDRHLPVARFGALWSQIVAEGVAHLTALPPGQRTTLAYEDVLDDPDGQLSRLAGFAGVEPDRGWLAAARALLDPARRDAARALPAPELAALETACAPGARALAEAG